MQLRRNPNAVMPGSLRSIVPFSRLSTEALIVAAGRAELARFRDGDVLLEIGSTSDEDYFLLEGQVQLVSADGKAKVISSGDSDAASALATIRPSLYEVRARGRVSAARMARETVAMLRKPCLTEDDTELVEFENTLSQTQQLWQGIKADIASDRLRLPSQPELATRLRDAVGRASCDNRRIANLVAADPAIAAKILKTANSPLCRGSEAVTSLAEAVSRIGLETVGELVICFSLKDLFQCASPSLRQLFAAQVDEAVRVGACAAVIASRVAPVQSDQALVAGLLCNIGAFPVFERMGERGELPGNSGPIEGPDPQVVAKVGEIICARWHLGAPIIEAVARGHNWGYACEGEFTLAEIVICARFHAWLGLGAKYRKALPNPDSVPSLRILAPNRFPQDSLEIVRDAKSRIDALMSAIN